MNPTVVVSHWSIDKFGIFCREQILWIYESCKCHKLFISSNFINSFKSNCMYIYSFLIDLQMSYINIKWSYTIYTTNLCVELEGDIKICSKSRISFVRKNYTLQTSHRNSKMRNLWITRADFHGGMYDRDSYLISRFYPATK